MAEIATLGDPCIPWILQFIQKFLCILLDNLGWHTVSTNLGSSFWDIALKDTTLTSKCKEWQFNKKSNIFWSDLALISFYVSFIIAGSIEWIEKKMKSLVIFVTILVSRITCLSLDEIHSSSKTFKSVSHNNRDKSLRTAIDTIRRRRQEYPIAQLYGPFSLPLKYYESLVPNNKISDQQVVNDLLGVSSSL